MQIPLLTCSVMIALGVVPVPTLKILALAASIPAEPRSLLLQRASQLAVSAVPDARAKRSPLDGMASDSGAPAGGWQRLGEAGAPGAALVGMKDVWRRPDVAAAEGDSGSSTGSGQDEATTEESYESSDSDGSDFGSDILNTLMEVVGALLSFFTDPPGAIQKMVEQAKQLTGGARSLMATVREQRQAGTPVPDGLPGMIDQFKKVVDAALRVAELGPAGARQARLMLEEARRILETARGIVETTGRVSNAARNVAQTIARPWQG